MQGTLDTTFGTFQRDLFESGLVAQIGATCSPSDRHKEPCRFPDREGMAVHPPPPL